MFSSPNLPDIDECYEPFTFDYEHLQKASELQGVPTARMHYALTGKLQEKLFGGGFI